MGFGSDAVASTAEGASAGSMFGPAGGLVGAGLGLVGGLSSSILGYNAQKDTNALNEKLTREGWARDDNAVQRRVADLKAAGLNPVLAAGSAAASGGPIKVADAPPVGNPIGSMLQGAQMAQGIIDIDRTRAQKELIDAQKHFLQTSKTKQVNAQTALSANNAGIAASDLANILRGNDPRYRNNLGQISNMARRALDAWGSVGEWATPHVMRYAAQHGVTMDQMRQAVDFFRGLPGFPARR